jgi:hypothetical protein
LWGMAGKCERQVTPNALGTPTGSPFETRPGTSSPDRPGRASMARALKLPESQSLSAFLDEAASISQTQDFRPIAVNLNH